MTVPVVTYIQSMQIKPETCLKTSGRKPFNYLNYNLNHSIIHIYGFTTGIICVAWLCDREVDLRPRGHDLRQRGRDLTTGPAIPFSCNNHGQANDTHVALSPTSITGKSQVRHDTSSIA